MKGNAAAAEDVACCLSVPLKLNKIEIIIIEMPSSKRTPHHWLTTTDLVDEESWKEAAYYKHALYRRALVVGLARNGCLSRILTYTSSQNQGQISRKTDIGLQYYRHKVYDLHMH